MTPHRGHERLTVSTTGLATLPAFVYHRMQKVFRPYLWKFVHVYMDDVIIFSHTIQEQLPVTELNYQQDKLLPQCREA
jgi:hypothetical protein